MDDNCFAVADYGNNRIMVMSPESVVDVAYDISIFPAGMKPVQYPDNFDPDTGVLHCPVEKLVDVGPVTVILQPE